MSSSKLYNVRDLFVEYQAFILHNYCGYFVSVLIFFLFAVGSIDLGYLISESNSDSVTSASCIPDA